MNEPTTRKQVVQSVTLASVPVAITAIAQSIFGELELILQLPIIAVSYALSALLIFLYNKYIGNVKRFRPYKKYEGIWVEIISGFKRPISICRIYFKNNEYHFDGVNFDMSANTTIEFTSKKIIPDTERGFYYITESNQLSRLEGFGKIYSLPRWPNNKATAKGYFFDVTTAEEHIHETMMIRFDKNFCENKLKDSTINPDNLSEREIFDHIAKYIDDNYALETKK